MRANTFTICPNCKPTREFFPFRRFFCTNVANLSTCVVAHLDVPTRGKLVLYRTERSIGWILEKANFSLDKAKADGQKGNYNTTLTVIVGDFQVDYDLATDFNHLQNIMLPNECTIFVTKSSGNIESTNKDAVKKAQKQIQESRVHLEKLINLGSIDAISKIEMILQLYQEIDIL